MSPLGQALVVPGLCALVIWARLASLVARQPPWVAGMKRALLVLGAGLCVVGLLSLLSST